MTWCGLQKTPLDIVMANLLQCRIVTSTFLQDELRFSHNELMKLHAMESRLRRLPPLFAAFGRTLISVQALGKCSRDWQGQEQTQLCSHAGESAIDEMVSNYQERSTAYDQHAKFLLQRVYGTSQAISDTLSLKHQKVTQDTNHSTLALADVTVRDSATIRVITFVTLVYLPSTFVAVSPPDPSGRISAADKCQTVFGMGFFNNGLVAAPRLWIFFALAVPLTVMTLAGGKWMEIRQRRSSDRSENGCGDEEKVGF